MSKMNHGFLGSTFPPGYTAWTCDVCTAMCNFEAMGQCARRFDPSSDCGFDRDQPESAGGCFEFMVRPDRTEGEDDGA